MVPVRCGPTGRAGTRPRLPAPLLRAWFVLLALVMVAGCGQADVVAEASGGDTSGGRSADGDAGCPTVQTFDEIPEHVVVDHQRVAEIMAAIGEGGRVAGVLGDMLSVPPAAVADEVVDMPFLGGGPGAPVAAAVLEDVGADATVLTGAVGDPPTAGEVVELGAACGDAPQSIDDALDEILQIGRLFAADRPARRVVRDLRARIDDLRAKGQPRHPLVLTRAGTSQEPLRPANGLIAELVELAGGTDVVPATGDARAAVRSSDAQVFLVVGHASEEDPSGMLCSITSTVSDDLFRAFPNVPATRAEQAITLPSEPSFGGLRVVDDTKWLANQIAAASSAG